MLPAATLLLASFAVAQEPAPFQGGFPPPHEVQKARDEAGFQRAVTAYRLRSLFELKDTADAKSIDLYFGPNAPASREGRWIQTIPGKW
jgi:hypothetical protein